MNRQGMKALLVATVVAVVVAFPGKALAANILLNAGFESGALAPWANSLDFCGGCVWSVTNTDAHAGAFSATVSGNRLLEQSFAPVNTGLIGLAGLWLKMPETGIAAVRFDYSDATFEENIVNVGADWQFFNMTAFLDAGKNLVSFGVFGCSGGGACPGQHVTLADDFVIDARAVPEPLSLFLLGTGVAATAVVRRGKNRRTQ
jgi:hypothetical protein